MPQITLYVDEDTRRLIERAASSSGLSQSRWVAEAIRAQAANVWPEAFLNLAGCFPDFPLREDAKPSAEDSPRLSW